MNINELKELVKHCVYIEKGITCMSDTYYNNIIQTIENLQSKIYNFNLFKIFLQERLLELKDNIERGINDFDAKYECEYILDKFTYFLKEDK